MKSILVAARERIADSKNWTTIYSAVDAHGKPVLANDLRACKWCMYGAVQLACMEASVTPTEIVNRIAAKCEELFGMNGSAVNDNKGHAAVLQVFDSLIGEQ